MSTSDSRSLRELINALAAARPAIDRAEPWQRRQSNYRDLAAHEDPMIREIGEQLRDGTIRPYELLSIPGYLEVVSQWLEQLKRLNDEMDMEEVHTELARRVAEAESEWQNDR